MILLSQWYSEPNEIRRSELLQARAANEASGLFDRCLYVDGASRRWTYGDFVDLAADSFPGEVIVLANTDIAFDETINLAAEAASANRVIALTRWESPSGPRMLGHTLSCGRFFSGSQDTWVFKAGGLPNPPSLRRVPLGAVGCDQVCVGEWVTAGCEVFDPALDIRTWHVHADDSRPDDREAVFGLYGYPELTTLQATGLVATHDWPSASGKMELALRKTWHG